MKLVLLGAPGSGKGTQAKRLEAKYNLPHISTGDMFRRAVEKKSELAAELKSIMESGKLVPDEMVIKVVNQRLQEEDCGKGFILDGFPRTLAQAEALDSIMAGEKADHVLFIELGEEEIVKRLSGRRMCSGCKEGFHVEFQPPAKDNICDSCGEPLFQRDDDKEETIRQRIKVYNEETAPLIDYYSGQGVLKTINGENSMDAVFGDLCGFIDGALQ